MFSVEVHHPYHNKIGRTDVHKENYAVPGLQFDDSVTEPKEPAILARTAKIIIPENSANKSNDSLAVRISTRAQRVEFSHIWLNATFPAR